MVQVPKTRKTYCKKCNSHTNHKVSQYKKSKESTHAQGRRRYDMKQSGFGGQTKPIFRKKAKTTKKVALKFDCTTCKTKRVIPIKRCKTIVFMDITQIKKAKVNKKDPNW
ncbi:60S ribosomal protein L36a (macronuclear) [Tetrahymena thermophila SB210]|uniref:Large ribosomal subunit protein eL42 n=1 Tax=Tetrahymena thermophila (strain SB210) TaxID=312017 RepID=RL36A_TETTS|nr:60S ribosomal protein L36a [Tetrahymena thermophila SB210]Q22X38.1 RecName: Full=Large ribosomal subunit protein eL42; AltName: Full=60S ribosomal protein L36a; AltName: Full=60S ribosomal protein L44 [Tetrahymena thermophila SB210]4V8P_AC Chain AC, 60S RIBOSOMAL PROTEIN L36A [Tetrahymena thermophila]4V8P_DC Chain DC, 60S RIBOSOMAL PROTEIN L36A [Tetrahymena thermophila]4V8P_FC Chain FC, 60S RIBOSOMAL PROTEIN L36A [Tetrahymena thermophila]4V8P_HC Chain HC, 60S RIBOSOMAL PROTEIN L36A [Tetrahy|eukprot:XP_001010053.1 60S ribosomal protein L36a [Tetrahymena thermophila SB210]